MKQTHWNMIIASINLHIVFLSVLIFSFIQIHKGKTNEDEICGGIKTGSSSKFIESGEHINGRKEEEVVVISKSLDTSQVCAGIEREHPQVILFYRSGPFVLLQL